jgi:hypothetical protein
VSTPELTALDLAADQQRGGGVSNVATVLIELADAACWTPAGLPTRPRTSRPTCSHLAAVTAAT